LIARHIIILILSWPVLSISKVHPARKSPLNSTFKHRRIQTLSIKPNGLNEMSFSRIFAWASQKKEQPDAALL
jgi:hypothetical protein